MTVAVHPLAIFRHTHNGSRQVRQATEWLADGIGRLIIAVTVDRVHGETDWLLGESGESVSCPHLHCC
ncbi:MAG: hypothetical protein CVV12_09935 [Gammaproteobacteria bacterium HGW-Gammaproteobacteria-2]|nr:MAG: hypothetical protein CVV12_09935 [Gammaproteobacteria bacterium HGW-Gammaproteobacteria-2]